MLTKKYFDDWLEELDRQYFVLASPQISLLDMVFSGASSNDRGYLGAGAVMGEIIRVRSLRDELNSKGLLK